ncbi:protein of unknown function [Burkholderia multivorans]
MPGLLKLRHQVELFGQLDITMIFIDAESLSKGLGGYHAIAVAITTRIPFSFNVASASGVVVLIGSATASKPAKRPSTDRYMTLAPCARMLSASLASGSTDT